MNTDELIKFVTEMDPSDAPPEIIAKLYDNVGSITRFAAAVSARANELAKAQMLPGYGLKPGKTCALAWVGLGPFPETWYERNLLSPTQIVKQHLSSEKALTEAGLAARPESDKVPVKLGDKEGNELF